jgi:hypothetical protein
MRVGADIGLADIVAENDQDVQLTRLCACSASQNVSASKPDSLKADRDSVMADPRPPL